MADLLTEAVIRRLVAGERAGTVGFDLAVRAPRGARVVHGYGKRSRVRTGGERTLVLPHGLRVKVTTDASGVATQIEDGEHLHAVARPETYRMTVRKAER